MRRVTRTVTALSAFLSPTPHKISINGPVTKTRATSTLVATALPAKAQDQDHEPHPPRQRQHTVATENENKSHSSNKIEGLRNQFEGEKSCSNQHEVETKGGTTTTTHRGISFPVDTILSTVEIMNHAHPTKTNVILDTYHIPVVTSTQDETKRILKQRQQKVISAATDDNKNNVATILSVSATEQRAGRGTRGRDWISRRGNTFVTIAVPTSAIPVPMTLLPIKIGTIMASHISHLFQNSSDPPKVTVKWPNDVLVNEEKIAGVLIENAPDGDNNYWFLVGIGVNVAEAPAVPSAGPQRGRGATCVQRYRPVEDNVSRARELGRDLAKGVAQWVSDGRGGSGGEDVVAEWERWAEWGTKQVLRDKEGNEVVVPVGIAGDGQLRVIGEDGVERLLSADYLL